MSETSVLVVDDDFVISANLAEMLEVMGYDICAIEATEAEAVTAAIRCRPDLMIVDVQLGQGSGVSAVEEILRTLAVPHVFVSGDIAKIRALRPGSVSIQKPFRESDLARAIRSVLGPKAAS